MIITLLFGFTIPYPLLFFFFFFNDTATTEIYTLSLHDALPICRRPSLPVRLPRRPSRPAADQREIRSRARHHPAAGPGARDHAANRLAPRRLRHARPLPEPRSRPVPAGGCGLEGVSAHDRLARHPVQPRLL